MKKFTLLTKLCFCILFFNTTTAFSQYNIKNFVFVSNGKISAGGSIVDVGRYSTPTFGDMNGDGHLDLMVGELDNGTRNVNLYLNNGDGTLNANSGTINMSHYTSPTTADIDNDDDIDLCIGDQYGFMKVYLNDGTGMLTYSHYIQVEGVNVDIGNYSSPVYADLDSDGDLDLYVGEGGGTINILENIGSNEFIFAGDLQANGTAIDIGNQSTPVFADVDKDGNLDLYVGSSEGTLYKYINDGSGNFYSAGRVQSAGSDIDVGSNSTPAFADLDNDGDLDLFMGENLGEVFVFQNTAIHPNIDTLVDIESECSITPTAPNAIDYLGNVIIGTTDTTFPIETQGTTVITWTYEDALGNITTQLQNVIVDDVTNPEIPTLEDVSGECSVTVEAPTTTDACAGTITGTTNDPLTYTIQGNYLITWTFDDGNGNVVTQTQNVIIEDKTDPIIECVDDQIYELQDGETVYKVADIDPTVSDNCNTSLVNDYNNSNTLNNAEFFEGTTTVTWTATDDAGNLSTCSFNIVVNKTTAIEDLKENDVVVYPNPASGVFRVKMINPDIDEVKVEIYNIVGKIVYTDLFYKGNIEFNASALEQGMYFIKVSSRNHSVTKSLVIK